MKIIQIDYALGSGGAERFVVDLCNQLADMGHEVTFCMLLSDSDNPDWIFNKKNLNSKVSFHSMGFTKGFSLKKVLDVTRYIHKECPDIVHCHLNVIPYVFISALIERNIKFYHTLHNIATKTCGSKYQIPLNKYFYKKNLIRPITISKECQTSYERLYKLNNAPFINNGRSKVVLSKNLAFVKDEIDSYKKDENTIVFIHVARFNKQKNQNLLIDVFNELNKLNHNFILLIIGNGFSCKEAKLLRGKACDKIYFLGEKQNVGDYYTYSDAFCLTSDFEGLPITLLEALCCGVTPICTPVGGIPNVVINGITGFISKENSIESFLMAIDDYFNHPIPRISLVRYFEENYAMKNCAEKYLDLYKKYNV